MNYLQNIINMIENKSIDLPKDKHLNIVFILKDFICQNSIPLDNVAKKLGLKNGSYSTTFQSRLGFDPWLKPYTDRTIERMGKEGLKKMAIVTPAFVSDCLETLEEIAMEGEEIFHEVGGEEFTVIPCLNERDDFAQVLANIIEEWATSETVTV